MNKLFPYHHLDLLQRLSTKSLSYPSGEDEEETVNPSSSDYVGSSPTAPILSMKIISKYSP